jgi:hypothetical protein
MKAPIRRVEDTVPALARVAPHNAEAERQLLGAILVNNETYYRVSDFLEPGHFLLEQQVRNMAENRRPGGAFRRTGGNSAF